MTTPIEERISALIDGEAGAFEARRLTRELTSNEALKAKWSRYHLIGDALRGELPERIPNDFSRQVLARIHDEMPGYDSSTEPSGSRWLKPLAGVAIAASVAAISVLMLKSLTATNESAPQIEVAATTPDAAVAQQVIAPPKATPVAVVQAEDVAATNAAPLPKGAVKTLEARLVDPRMESYLTTHAEYATHPVLLPQVRVVGFNAEEP